LENKKHENDFNFFAIAEECPYAKQALPFFLDKKTKEKSQGCQRKTT
jgi:hypothetical protein